jgi:cytochrome c
MLRVLLAVILAGLVFTVGAFATVSGASQPALQVSVTPRPSATFAPTAEPTPAALVGDPVRGQQIFAQGVNGAPPCSSCHGTSGGRNAFQLAPNMIGLDERAGQRVAGLSAEAYIHQSIVEPEAYLVPGFRPIMPPTFGETLTEQDIADLIAFLLTL